jgi:antitoxin component YwqK of YwqJK toxin-antitoxin module
VAPAASFSGVWTVYFVNGQRSHEIHYADGKYFGEFTAFRSDGSKLFVQHYGPSGIDGEDTGYFPSGRIMYRAYYKKGTAIGTWTHYNEDGSVRSTTEHPEPSK